jgi:peptidoglycan/xylan/chitin deacetylase (PgdA/CDA1 family)
VADWQRPRLAFMVLSFLVVAGLTAAAIAALPLARKMLRGNAPNAAAAQQKHVQGQHEKTVVSLTFDDAYEDQWQYAVPLLRSNDMNATFYVITADSDRPYPCCMSWAQLRTLQGEGDDIGSHTISHPRLTTLTTARVTRQICGSRMDMLRNGINDPESFAYPYGSYNKANERAAARCGFTNARQGGGISSSDVKPGPPWAERLPPKDPEAVRTIAVDGQSPMLLSDLESYVNATVAHHGDWLPITFHDVCDPYAPDYTHCMSTYGPISDTVLGQFLNWLHRAGHPGGAPAGVVVETMRWAMNTVKGPDTTPPLTKATCDGAPCNAAGYGLAVRVGLPASDTGGVGVAKTYYTTDGSTPGSSSQVYQTPLVLHHSETIKFFSVDNAGNTEKVQTVKIRIG